MELHKCVRYKWHSLAQRKVNQNMSDSYMNSFAVPGRSPSDSFWRSELTLQSRCGIFHKANSLKCKSQSSGGNFGS